MAPHLRCTMRALFGCHASVSEDLPMHRGGRPNSVFYFVFFLSCFSLCLSAREKAFNISSWTIQFLIRSGSATDKHSRDFPSLNTQNNRRSNNRGGQTALHREQDSTLLPVGSENVQQSSFPISSFLADARQCGERKSRPALQAAKTKTQTKYNSSMR